MADKIQDYCSGQMVPSTPEEYEAVQPLVKLLVEDYGYPMDCVLAHPQHRVKARPSDRKKEYPVDVAVFNDSTKKDKDLYIICECKKKTRKDGRDQLEDYMRLSKARLGIWYNGKESLYIRKIEHDGIVEFKPIPNIPKFGQRVEDIGKFTRKDLKDTHNLKSIFRSIHNYLAGNAVGVTKNEILAQQLINLIFCKIYDEMFTAPDDICRFRVGYGEEPETVRTRILNIFTDVKERYKDVMSNSDEIIFDANSIVYVVGELQNYCLISTERDIIADAFEVFIDDVVKGGQGQFFTPRNIIKMIVEIAHPGETNTVLDTCCGSGGFLIETMRYVWNNIENARHALNWSDTSINEDKKEYAMNKLFGLEKDAFLTKLTKAYMTILGDGKSGIFCEDSLEVPNKWSVATKSKIRLNGFSWIMTNPPFGKEIKVSGKEKLEQYSLAYKIENGKEKLQDKGNISTLFLERDLQMLEDGGHLAIILPETYFHAPKQSFVRQFIYNHNIEWIIDLAHNTFRPHCNAKCIVVIIQKNRPQQPIINMAITEYIGHDHIGNPIFVDSIDDNGNTISRINDDTEYIIQEVRCMLNHKPYQQKYTFSVDANIVKSKDILIPRYYWNLKMNDIRLEATSSNLTLLKLQSLIDDGTVTYFDGNGSPSSEYKGTGIYPYIRVKDIVNWQIYKDPTAMIPKEEFDKLYNKEKQLKPKDIVFVRRGSYRIGSVAMVSPYDLNVILTREILVLRVNPNNIHNITPEYLLYALSHELVQPQIKNKVFIETTLPNIADRWKELEIPIFNDPNEFNHIKNKTKAIIDAQWGVLERIEELKKNYSVYNT